MTKHRAVSPQQLSFLYRCCNPSPGFCPGEVPCPSVCPDTSVHTLGAGVLAPEASRCLRSSGAITCNLVWATGRLMSPYRGFGTSYQLHSGQLTVSPSSGNNLKRIYLLKTEAAAP